MTLISAYIHRGAYVHYIELFIRGENLGGSVRILFLLVRCMMNVQTSRFHMYTSNVFLFHKAEDQQHTKIEAEDAKSNHDQSMHITSPITTIQSQSGNDESYTIKRRVYVFVCLFVLS